MTKEIITLKQITTYLNISTSEIRKLVRQRDIPYFRIGNKLHFDVNKINLWVENLEKKEEKTFVV